MWDLCAPLSYSRWRCSWHHHMLHNSGRAQKLPGKQQEDNYPLLRRPRTLLPHSCMPPASAFGCSDTSASNRQPQRLKRIQGDTDNQAIQFYPWLSRERSCTSGNTGYSTEISITVNSCWSGVALSTWLWQTPAQGSSSQPQYCSWLLPQWRCCSLSDVRVKCWGRNLDAHRASSAV